MISTTATLEEVEEEVGRLRGQLRAQGFAPMRAIDVSMAPFGYYPMDDVGTCETCGAVREFRTTVVPGDFSEDFRRAGNKDGVALEESKKAAVAWISICPVCASRHRTCVIRDKEHGDWHFDENGKELAAPTSDD